MSTETEVATEEPKSLNDLVGKKVRVTIYKGSNSATATGILLGFDKEWLRVQEGFPPLKSYCFINRSSVSYIDHQPDPVPPRRELQLQSSNGS